MSYDGTAGGTRRVWWVWVWVWCRCWELGRVALRCVGIPRVVHRYRIALGLESLRCVLVEEGECYSDDTYIATPSIPHPTLRPLRLNHVRQARNHHLRVGSAGVCSDDWSREYSECISYPLVEHSSSEQTRTSIGAGIKHWFEKLVMDPLSTYTIHHCW